MNEDDVNIEQTLSDLRGIIKALRSEIRDLIKQNETCERSNERLCIEIRNVRNRALKDAAQMAENHIGDWTAADIAKAIRAMSDANG